MVSSKTACAMFPGIAIVLWYVVFLIFGVLTLSEDVSLRHDRCGASFHVYKFVSLNVGFAIFFLVTYFVMPSGGESARARSMLCLILHGAFATWGVLMLLHMDSSCLQVIREQYKNMYTQLYISMVHNTLCAMFFVLHELYIGAWLGYDLTVVFELHNNKHLNGGNIEKSGLGSPHSSYNQSGFSQASQSPPMMSDSNLQSVSANDATFAVKVQDEPASAASALIKNTVPAPLNPALKDTP